MIDAAHHRQPGHIIIFDLQTVVYLAGSGKIEHGYEGIQPHIFQVLLSGPPNLYEPTLAPP